MVLAANHKPIVRGTDFAIWRRIKVIPFVVTIPPKEQDRSLPEKLRAELPGILAWAVEGCLEWQKQGLGEPEEVRAASEDYRTEMDVLAAFIDARCVVAKTASAKASKLYEAYRIWADEVGEYAESQRRVGLRLAERGFTKEKVGVVHWYGIGLHYDGDDPDGGDEENPPKEGNVDLTRSTVDLTIDLTDAKGPREETPATGHISEEHVGSGGPYGPNLGVSQEILGHAGLTGKIGPQGPPRSTHAPPSKDPGSPETMSQAAVFEVVRECRESGKVVHVDGPHEYDLYVGRKSPKRGLPQSELRNPYTIGRDGNRDEVIEKYRRELEEKVASDPEFRARVRALAGKTLACWCAGKKGRPDVLHPGDELFCHAQVLLRVANRLAAEDDGPAPEDAGAEDAVWEYLSEPPGWLVDQVREYDRGGRAERLLAPMVSAVAYKVFGTSTRHGVTRPVVEEWVAGLLRTRLVK